MSEMIRFIDTYRDRFSVEFICTVLQAHRVGGFISSRGYLQVKSRGPSARALRDVVLVETIGRIHADNYGVYGVHKMWHALRRECIDLGREQTARLMRLAGVHCKSKGRSPVTTRKAKMADLRPDLVKCQFHADGPGRSVVSGRYYLCAHQGRICLCRVCHRCVYP